MVNMRTAASVTPGKLAELPLLPTTETTQYQPAAGVGTQVATATLHNISGSDCNVWLSIVKSGASAGDSNRELSGVKMAAGDVLDLGGTAGLAYLNEGDFISAKAQTAGAIAINLTGIEFSNATGSVMSGIQPDAIGSGGHGAAGAVTGNNAIGTGLNRRLVAALMVIETGATLGWSSYTGGQPTLSCTQGAMTREASVDFNNGSSIVGSVHLFTYDNPTAGSNQALSGAAAATGATMGLVLASKSYSGVNLSAALNPVSSGPSGAAVLSLPFTTAAGHVPVLAGAFFAPPQALNMSAIRFDGLTSGFTVPQWLLMADLFGASALTAAVSNSTDFAAVGFDMTPA